MSETIIRVNASPEDEAEGYYWVGNSIEHMFVETNENDPNALKGYPLIVGPIPYPTKVLSAGDLAVAAELAKEVLDREKRNKSPFEDYEERVAAATRLKASDGETKMSTGAERIVAERKRQIEEEGWTLDHDQGHALGELAIQAASLAVDGTDAHVEDPHGRHGSQDDAWGLMAKYGYRNRGNDIQKLVVAGALIAAEIDRLLRGEEKS